MILHIINAGIRVTNDAEFLWYAMECQIHADQT